MICYRYQRKGHISKECKLPKDKLKCTHCNTVGRHLTNNWCKDQLKKKEDEKKAGAQQKPMQSLVERTLQRETAERKKRPKLKR